MSISIFRSRRLPRGSAVWRHVPRIFLQGLVAILPVVVTVYLLVVLAWWLDATVRSALLLFVPKAYEETFVAYLPPGIGVISTVILIFLVGLLLNAYLVRRAYDLTEGFMQRIPVIKSIYGAVKDFLSYFAGGRPREMNQVVSCVCRTASRSCWDW